jgi:D-alanyl-D-alanine carboxypeptidase/D-alanyl-D-alanine-endopeptidase (penicillin-binding protein 4)
MRNNKFLIKFILIFIISLSITFPQDFNPEIVEELNEIFEDEYFQSTTLAVSIFDLTTGNYLYRKNDKQLLHPASNMKVITSATGLEYLGPEYTFGTSVYHTGIIMDSVCYGDIVVV